MENTFKTICSTPTPLDEFKDFDVINYSTISDTKATRLSELRNKVYPENYILEVFEKTEKQMHYKAHTFKSLEEALNYQSKVA